MSDPLPNALDVLATIVLATETTRSSHDIQDVTPKKRRTSDINFIADQHTSSERWSKMSLKASGVHSLVASRVLSQSW